MNKTAIKNFAIWARNKLIADVSYDARLIGITEDGIVKPLPQSFGGTQFFDIGTAEPYSISGEAVRQRDKLIEVIQQKEKDTDYKTAYQYVIEEVAYTWFNRLIAIRFMEVNDYLPSHIRVLSSESGKLEPDLVTTPFDAELPFTAEEEAQIFQLKQDNKLDEVFRILFLKQCNALNEILPALFEKTKNYTELLLSLSVIDQDGVVYHLIHDIPEDDFNIERGGQVEIIGWLYQYYNTEPKAAAFAKNGKITKEEIPAVTQLFTPDWIVRYMVENSLGRLWVEGHPDCGLKENWKYYLEEAQQEPEVQAKLSEIRKEYAAMNPEDIKLIDPCMGSGHILVYAFDVLMQIYESAGYSQRDAAKSILEHNIYGLDIDDRAYQLAYFAVMMKARQYNRRILNGENTCHIYAIQESNSINRAHLKYFGAGMDDIEKNAAKMQLEGLLDTLTDAKEYGSIVNVESYNWELLRRFVAAEDTDGQISMDSVGVEDTAEQLNRLIDIGETASRKYDIVVTNPPYRAVADCTERLNSFVKANYPDSKNDLSTIFMEKTLSMSKPHGFMAMINIPVWMSKSSFEQLRYKLLALHTFVAVAHCGRGIFGSDFGTVAFVVQNSHIKMYKALFRQLDKYFRLGKNLNQRDTIAVRKIVGGYVKLLYPDGEFTKEQIEEILVFALEMRRRVKEQLKKLGGMEFYDVNFSYIDLDTFEEKFVSVPEQGGGKLIPDGICNPGQVYTVSQGKSGMIGVFRLESQMLPGNGKFERTGLGSDRDCKESTNTAFNFLKANGNRISGSISTTMRDYIINYQDLQGIGMTGKLALPTLIALCSIALGRPTVSTLAVLGEISISGTILKVDELANSLQVCLDSGAKKVLLPITSAADLGTVPPELVGSFNLIFYSSAEDAVFKALGVE